MTMMEAWSWSGWTRLREERINERLENNTHVKCYTLLIFCQFVRIVIQLRQSDPKVSSLPTSSALGQRLGTFPLPLPLSAERVSESEIGLGSIKSVSSFPGLHLPVKIGATEPRRHVHPQLQSIGIKRKPSTTFRNELDSTELPFHLWTC